MPLSAEAQRLMDQVAVIRKLVLAERETVWGIKKGGDSERVVKEVNTVLLPLVNRYLKALADLEQQELAEFQALQETFVHQRAANAGVVWGMVFVMALLVMGGTWILLGQIRAPLNHVIDVTQAIAGGDLQTPVRVSRGDEFGALLRAVDRMQQSWMAVVANVRRGSEALSQASTEIANGNQDLSARTESQVSALQHTSSSMHQLNTTVQQNAESAQLANKLALNASAVAKKSGEAVTQVVETMNRINESSRRISDIISVIDGIAFQTNILALNAAVEAARAGEQGRGFAVVASEVRLLAGRSAEAAKEIKSLISVSVERVETGTVQADVAGSTMTEVVQAIGRVTDIVGEISAASSAQSLEVAQVGMAIQQMDQTTQRNAALVEEMAAAASSLKSQANELVETVSIFRIG